jgi:hypothetical protein
MVAALLGEVAEGDRFLTVAARREGGSRFGLVDADRSLTVAALLGEVAEGDRFLTVAARREGARGLGWSMLTAP